MRSNPINESDSAETIRQFIISKIERLEILNRTAVTVNNMGLKWTERLGAEVDYLKRFASEWTEANKSEDKNKLAEFKYAHPTYEKLIKSKKNLN